MSLFIQQFNCQPQFIYGNPPDSIPLWVAAREDNTLSSRLTRPSHFPFVSFISSQQYGHLAWELPRLPNKKCISNEMHFLFASFLPSQAVPGKYFRPHLVNRVDFASSMTSARITPAPAVAAYRLTPQLSGFSHI